MSYILSILLFSFALLTDTHISTSNPRPMEDLQRSIADINQNPAIEFVVVTGDLTESGDRASIQAIKDELEKLNVPFYAASGNHETTWSESGVMDFSRVFGDSRFAFSHNGMYFIGFNSGPVIRMADGHVAPQDIAWLKHNLDSISQLSYTSSASDRSSESEIRTLNSQLSLVLCTWGFGTREQMEGAKPDYLVDHPLEVLKVVEGF